MASKTSAKSAKAIKAASRRRTPSGKPPLMQRIPWLTVGAALVLVAFVASLGVYLYPKWSDRQEAEQYASEAKKFEPSKDNTDPSAKIEGVVKIDYPAALHVKPDQRVAYDQAPPFGGPHDSAWAQCMGTVYSKPIRTENAVHSLEHGAVWIAYNPDLDADSVSKLEKRVAGQQYTLMSPYPGLDKPIALLSWGHQLKVDSATDNRIDHFIGALRLNRYGAYPEVGASCTNPTFDVDNPPPFDATPPGPNAIPMDGKGATSDGAETGGIPGMPGGIPGLPGGIPGAPAPAPGGAPAPAPGGAPAPAPGGAPAPGN